MFLLVSGRHVGAHPDGYQHGVSIQVSINLGKKFLRISCIRKIAVTWNLARVFAYLPSFFSQNLDFIYWMVLIFTLNGVTLKTSNTYRLKKILLCKWASRIHEYLTNSGRKEYTFANSGSRAGLSQLFNFFKYIHSPSRVPAIVTNDCACNHLSSGNKHKMKTTRWRIGEFNQNE